MLSAIVNFVSLLKPIYKLKLSLVTDHVDI